MPLFRQSTPDSLVSQTPHHYHRVLSLSCFAHLLNPCLPIGDWATSGRNTFLFCFLTMWRDTKSSNPYSQATQSKLSLWHLSLRRGNTRFLSNKCKEIVKITFIGAFKIKERGGRRISFCVPSYWVRRRVQMGNVCLSFFLWSKIEHLDQEMMTCFYLNRHAKRKIVADTWMREWGWRSYIANFSNDHLKGYLDACAKILKIPFNLKKKGGRNDIRHQFVQWDWENGNDKRTRSKNSLNIWKGEKIMRIRLEMTEIFREFATFVLNKQ